jgi:hypothetical protein
VEEEGEETMTKGNATCETCPYWTEIEPAGGERVRAGYCHHVANEANSRNYVDYDWWCSEHPDLQRDRLAAMAMPAVGSLLAGTRWAPTDIPRLVYQIADAMLAERKKGA